MAQWNSIFATEIGLYRLPDADCQFSASHSDSNYPCVHLCCRWPPPRLAHDSTLMSDAPFYESSSRKLQCCIKDLHKMKLFHTIVCVYSILRFSTSSITKCSRSCGQCTKVMLATVGNATFPANAVTSIDIHHICDNTKETASGFAK